MELNELLTTRIEKEFESLDNLATGSKEKSETVDDLCKLYKVYLEDNRMNNEFYDKQERRELDKDIHDDEMLLRDREVAVRELDVKSKEKDTEFKERDLKLKETQIREEYSARAVENANNRVNSEREDKREKNKFIAETGIAVGGMVLGFVGLLIGMNYEKTGNILSQSGRNLVQRGWKLWK